MKMNKKLIVPFLSTIIGLSIAGGLGGAFAWYQFNSQVKTSFIGSSVAEGGLLQVKHGSDHWGSSYTHHTNGGQPDDNKMIPVTFGAMGANNALPSQAYGRPEAGAQGSTDYGTGWDKITAEKGYAQYTIKLRALTADKTSEGDAGEEINPGYKLAAKKVYLSDIVIDGVKNGAAIADNVIADALRIHIAVKNGDNFLISKTAVSNMALSGKLDLDGDGQLDKKDAYEWQMTGTDQDYVTYGVSGQTQTTTGKAGIINTRNTDGTMPDDADRLICTTSLTETVELTVTIWLEGWAVLNGATTAVWNPNLNSGVDVRVGMTFDAGRDILA